MIHMTYRQDGETSYRLQAPRHIFDTYISQHQHDGRVVGGNIMTINKSSLTSSFLSLPGSRLPLLWLCPRLVTCTVVVCGFEELDSKTKKVMSPHHSYHVSKGSQFSQSAVWVFFQ